jgi:hypothetical protein
MDGDTNVAKIAIALGAANVGEKFAKQCFLTTCMYKHYDIAKLLIEKAKKSGYYYRNIWLNTACENAHYDTRIVKFILDDAAKDKYPLNLNKALEKALLDEYEVSLLLCQRGAKLDNPNVETYVGFDRLMHLVRTYNLELYDVFDRNYRHYFREYMRKHRKIMTDILPKELAEKIMKHVSIFL